MAADEMRANTSAYSLITLGNLLRAEERVEALTKAWLDSVPNIDERDIQKYLKESAEMITASEARKERIRTARRRRK